MDTKLIPTDNEIQILRKICYSLFAMVLAICATLCFVAAKMADKDISMEYRPIAVSNRTVVAGTAYQPSLSRATEIKVSAQLSCTSLVIAGASGNISLQVSPDNITYTTVSQITNSISGVLSLTNVNGAPLSAVVKAGYYYKIVNTTTTGSPTFSILTSAQETNL